MSNHASPSVVQVALGERTYDITISDGILDRLEEFLSQYVSEGRLFVVTEENVSALYEEKIKAALARGKFGGEWFTLAPGEGSKSFASFEMLTNELLDSGIERSDIIVALGGGVIGDLAGFAAASILRGIDFIQIPTSLLAQVDSSVGGKTGINTPYGKNLVGAFHQPKAVLIDPNVLMTLPPRELKAGYAELLKYGLIDDPDFFVWLEKNGCALLGENGHKPDLDLLAFAIKKGCEAKARVVAEDEREAGKRALLNLGHTFGHALEAACGYDSTLLHGEAVAVGMVMALDLSTRMDIAKPEDLGRLIKHYQSVGLLWSAAEIDRDLEADNLLAHMTKDKKTKAGDIGFILGGIGEAALHRGVDLKMVRAVLHDSICGNRPE